MQSYLNVTVSVRSVDYFMHVLRMCIILINTYKCCDNGYGVN